MTLYEAQFGHGHTIGDVIGQKMAQDDHHGRCADLRVRERWAITLFDASQHTFCTLWRDRKPESPKPKGKDKGTL